MNWANDITGLPLPDAVTTLGDAALVKVQASSNIVALAPFIPKVADAADPGNFLAACIHPDSNVGLVSIPSG